MTHDPSCMICAAPASAEPVDRARIPPGETTTALPEHLPPPQLCTEHWAKYRTDWLLIGWCTDHYGEALHHCPVHGRAIDPL
ncbi:MAG: hypothetical protein ACJ74O_15985 [Frankiaceae bacterium]